jgi:hypothetical protein
MVALVLSRSSVCSDGIHLAARQANALRVMLRCVWKLASQQRIV